VHIWNLDFFSFPLDFQDNRYKISDRNDGFIPKHKEEATDDIREKGERG